MRPPKNEDTLEFEAEDTVVPKKLAPEGVLSLFVNEEICCGLVVSLLALKPLNMVLVLVVVFGVDVIGCVEPLLLTL